MGSSNSKSVHTRVRTEVRHEVHVITEVRRFVDKEEVRTQAVDQEDLLERVVLVQTIKDQQQMIVDLQRRLLSFEQVTKKLRTGPYYNCNDVSDNFSVDGLDHQSMEGFSHCTSVDRLDKNRNDVLDNFLVDGLDHQSMEGVSHYTSVDHISQRLNEVDESVAIDGLIRLRSQDVDHTSKKSLVVDDNDFKVKDNEEADFLSTQQVTELMKEVFDTPSGPNSIKDVGGSESMNVDQPYLVKNVKDIDESDIKTVVSTEVKCNKRRRKLKLNKLKRVIKTIVDSDGNEIQLLPWTEDLTRSPNAPKRTVIVPEPIMSLFRDKNRMELKWTFSWVEDGHVV
nr:hypothetical protein [Tanacetum cinerariifolium]